MLRASRVIVVAAVLLCAWMMPGTPGSLLSPGQVQRELRDIREQWASRDRSCDPQERVRALAFIDQQIATAHSMPRAQLAHVLAEAAALSGDHRRLITIYDARGTFRSPPISFWWFPQASRAVLLFVSTDVDVGALYARAAGIVQSAHDARAQIGSRIHRG